eukprot:TRINITY_DN5364_c0_g1_i1.p1 TRINITY_DN5364_c0_g1~~TRINITY_DN5364_c0_g1_i1.p1  ORF type:complete len:442 (-),score=75.39 TRINITY_DN5364_c0_g1_i1:181-1506(-)
MTSRETYRGTAAAGWPSLGRRPSRPSAAILVAVLAAAVLPTTHAKMVMGIARGNDYQLVSTFCFSFPPPVFGEPEKRGRIRSQTIVSSNGHKLLVLNRSYLDRGLPCEQLVAAAKVVEPLNERTKEVIAYELTLNVERSMDRQQVATVIARCGQELSAEYIIEFTNPGGFLETQFACTDQGLLQSYLFLSLVLAGLAPVFLSAHRILHRRLAHNDVSACFFTGVGFFFARVWLFTGHLLAFSRNGLGLGMLLFVAQFLDFLSTTMTVLVLLAFVHGVYVTRPFVQQGSEERRTLLNVAGAFVCTNLLAALINGFKMDGDLTPFDILRGGWSWLYALVRLYTGIFCLNRGLKLAQEPDGLQKKPNLVRFSFLSMIWLGIFPLVMLFASDDSWHRDAMILDLTSIGVYSALLYDMWPSRFGALFSCVKPTERQHPYSEFGLPS